jgi:hypothetical protein
MVQASREQITGLLVAWSDGDQAALEKLMPLVYVELHRLAKRYMRQGARWSQPPNFGTSK